MNTLIAGSPAQKICRKCATPFDVRNCPTCKRVIAARWVVNNPGKIKAYNDLRRAQCDLERGGPARVRISLLSGQEKIIRKEEAREKALAAKKISREKNKASGNATIAQWRKANPEKCKIYRVNRRARKAIAGGKLSPGISEKLYKLQRGKCACCSKPLGSDYHLDHRMPLALGGANTDDNMQLLTATCNMQKSAKHPIDFMQSRGFLL